VLYSDALEAGSDDGDRCECICYSDAEERGASHSGFDVCYVIRINLLLFFNSL